MDPGRVTRRVPVGRRRPARAGARRRPHPRRRQRPQPHGPVGDAGHAEAAAAARAGVRRRRRRRGGRPGGAGDRRRRRGRRQPGGLADRGHRRPRQRQPDGSGLPDLGRAHVGRPCHAGHGTGAQRRGPPGEPVVGGVRCLPARLADRLPDAAAGPGPGRPHGARRGHRLRRVVRRPGDRPLPRGRGGGDEPQRIQARAGAGHGRRGGDRLRLPSGGRCRPTSSSRASGRRRGTSRCGR